MTHPDLARLAQYAELADGLTELGLIAQSLRDSDIKAIRADGVTLQTLADATDLSEGRVSRIARDKGAERGRG